MLLLNYLDTKCLTIDRIYFTYNKMTLPRLVYLAVYLDQAHLLDEITGDCLPKACDRSQSGMSSRRMAALQIARGAGKRYHLSALT